MGSWKEWDTDRDGAVSLDTAWQFNLASSFRLSVSVLAKRKVSRCQRTRYKTWQVEGEKNQRRWGLCHGNLQGRGGWTGVFTRIPISREPKSYLTWAEASEEEEHRVNKAEEDRAVGEMWDVMGMGRNREMNQEESQ